MFYSMRFGAGETLDAVCRRWHSEAGYRHYAYGPVTRKPPLLRRTYAYIPMIFEMLSTFIEGGE